jgi:hypothetical protein
MAGMVQAPRAWIYRVDLGSVRRGEERNYGDFRVHSVEA